MYFFFSFPLPMGALCFLSVLIHPNSFPDREKKCSVCSTKLSCQLLFFCTSPCLTTCSTLYIVRNCILFNVHLKIAADFWPMFLVSGSIYDCFPLAFLHQLIHFPIFTPYVNLKQIPHIMCFAHFICHCITL